MGVRLLSLDLFPENNMEEAENFPEALDLLDQKKYNLIILDTGIPGETDIKMINSVRKKQAKVPILTYTGA